MDNSIFKGAELIKTLQGIGKSTDPIYEKQESVRKVIAKIAMKKGLKGLKKAKKLVEHNYFSSNMKSILDYTIHIYKEKLKELDV